MNQETRKPGDQLGKQECRNFSNFFSGFVVSRFVPVPLLS